MSSTRPEVDQTYLTRRPASADLPPVFEAWRCAPVGLDGHRWPCLAAERRGERCTDQGCHR